MNWRQHETWSPDLGASVLVFGKIFLLSQIVINLIYYILLAKMHTNALVLGALPMFLILCIKGPMYKSNTGRLKFDRDVQKLGV